MDFATDFKAFDKAYPIQRKAVNELEFRYRVAGTGKKTLVFLVGGFGFSDIFYEYFLRFSEAYSVILFDYPTQTRRNIELADGIAALLRALGVDKVFLWGQSYGGLLAQVIADRHPEIVRGLILSNTGCLDADMSREARNKMFSMIRQLKVAKRLTWLIPTPILRKIILTGIHKDFASCMPPEKEYLNDLWRHMISRCTGRHERHMCSLMIDLCNEEKITKESFRYLDGNVLLIFSPDDNTFGDAVNQALIDLMPNPAVNRVISGGHLALLVKKELYIYTVMQFIDHRA